jgi:hypothetical protein
VEIMMEQVVRGKRDSREPVVEPDTAMIREQAMYYDPREAGFGPKDWVQILESRRRTDD